CRQRGGTPLSERTDYSGAGGRVAGTIRAVHAPASGTAREVHRPVPQLRDQLQPGQRPGGGARRDARGGRLDAGAPLAAVSAAHFIAPSAVGARRQVSSSNSQLSNEVRETERLVSVSHLGIEVDLNLYALCRDFPSRAA